MNITPYIEEFIKHSKNKPYKKICKSMLLGGKEYSLNSQDGYEESEFLPVIIPGCVKAYTNDKDSAINMFREFVEFLKRKGVPVQEIDFPPVPVSNSFERQMFIAKYLQDGTKRISGLPDILWVSDRTIEEDLSRLRGERDPIQVCGKKFCIPDTDRKNGMLRFASTAHPLFMVENLTQVMVMLKGLRHMAENPLYRSYAMLTASDIWNQLSSYAKNRIRFVLTELMPEELDWYENLAEYRDKEYFYTEKACSQVHNRGPSVMMDCMKNGKSFCVEYSDEEGTVLYKDCVFILGTYRDDAISVNCDKGVKILSFSCVIRSAYTVEELMAD